MVIYAVLAFILSLVFLFLGIMVFKGRTDILQEKGRNRVTDRKAYGKMFGSGLLIIALGLVLSGALALLGDSTLWLLLCFAVLMGGIVGGMVLIVKAQDTYNG